MPSFILSIIISLLLTVAIYFTPSVVFRFMIIRRPLSKKASIIIAIIWSIVSWIIFNVLRALLGEDISTNVVPAFLWGFINCNILQMQYKSSRHKEATDKEKTV